MERETRREPVITSGRKRYKGATLFTTLSFAANCGVPIRERDETRAICRDVFHTRFFAERKEKKGRGKGGKEKERRQKTFLSTKEHRYSPSPPLPLFCCLRIFPSGPYIMFFSFVFLARREFRVPQRENISFCSTANRLMPEIYRQWWSCFHIDKVDFSIIGPTYFPFFLFIDG